MDNSHARPDIFQQADPASHAPKAQYAAQMNHRLSVVGIGASAGGLRALQALFQALPADTGMTFVVVVHLSPEHESILAELLQPHTQMPVRQVTERVEMAPDHVYVIPPAKRLVVSQNHLDLTEFHMPRGRRLQIDTFFRSLAEHHGDGAAIILSGTGSDGAAGIGSIKEGGGLILVQEPGEAQYDGMPTSATATGLVDIVAPVADLVTQLVAAKRTGAALQLPADPDGLSEPAEQTLIQLLAQLRIRTGHDFSGYKRSTVLRRIGRRMQLAGQETLTGYLHHLRNDPDEAEALVDDLLIHVTQFFRDPEAWDALAEDVIPGLFAGKGRDDSVRAWTVGCATGEEAYSLGMLLLEHASTLDAPPDIQIFASDLGKMALEFARRGIYPEAIAANVSDARLNRFFERDDSHYRVRNELRERILFAPHNLLQDPPFSRLDLIVCRNVLIYLQREWQERVFHAFHYALHPEGYLFLGSAESNDSVGTLFDVVDKQHRFYRRSPESHNAAVPLELPTETSERQFAPQTQRPSPQAHLERQTHAKLLEEGGPPSLLVDAANNVLHLSETVGHYLKPAGGSFNNDVLRLVRPELHSALRNALTRALAGGRSVRTHPIFVRFNGESGWVSLLVHPNGTCTRALVMFLTEAAPDSEGGFGAETDGADGADTGEERGKCVQELEAELTFTQQRLRAIRKEYEATTEEVRAANEELQSTNEEYRSTMEELETSQEELQSINEELQTVNQELKKKVEETGRTNSDLQNLLAATEIATLFLDQELRIQRYTPRAAELFNLMPPDQGRPIGHLRTNLYYEELQADAQQVLDRLVPIEREVQSEDERWYQVNVRPYRTQDDRIDGVVITFVDVTANKANEVALSETKEYAESIVQTIPDALLVLETDLRMRSANDAFYDIFQVSPEATEGQLIYELGNNQWDIPELRILLEKILPDNNRFTGYEVDHTFETIGHRTMLINGQRLDHVQLILLVITDITRRKRSEDALRQARGRLEVALEAAHMGTWDLDVVNNQASTDLRHNQIFGYTEPISAWNPDIFLEHVLPADRAKFQTALERALETGELDVEVRVRWPDGSVHWIYDQGRVDYDDAGAPVRITGVTQEITERKWSEEELRRMNQSLEAQVRERTAQVRNLVTQLAMSEQDERHRISQILHDDLQQQLYGLQFQFAFLRGALDESSGEAEREEALRTLTETEEALHRSIGRTRSLSVELSPPVLAGEGLIETLSWLAAEMERQHGLSVAVLAADDTPVPRTDLRVLLFQIVRELLFNIVKHAGVDAATIALSRPDHVIRIEVTDAGGGFDVEAVQSEPARGPGLWRIQQRIELIGGQIEFSSTPGAGTQVVITCPVPDTEAQD